MERKRVKLGDDYVSSESEEEEEDSDLDSEEDGVEEDMEGPI